MDRIHFKKKAEPVQEMEISGVEKKILILARYLDRDPLKAFQKEMIGGEKTLILARNVWIGYDLRKF